jgi:fatty acid kinase
MLPGGIHPGNALAAVSRPVARIPLVISTLGAPELRRVILSALEALRSRQDEIDAANVYPVPDGDTGTNMVLTMNAVAEALAPVEDDPVALAHAIAHGSLMGARGNSGVILAQILRGLTELVDEDGLDPRGIAKGLARGSELGYEAVLTPVEGTMLTVVRAAAEAVAGEDGADCVAVLDRAGRAAHEALERTPELLPVLKYAGVVDAGGMGLCVVLDAAAAAIAGRPLPVVSRSLRAVVRNREAGSSAFAYEVQYLLEDAADDQVGTMRQRLGAIGDSVAVIGGAHLWNVHVHTNEVGRAIEIGMAVGRPRDISVVAFADQIAGTAGARIIPVAHASDAVSLVAVVSGDGLTELFASLGAGVLLDGGRTMNPSVGEIAAAIERAVASDVILLVNNDDAAPAARAALAGVNDKRVELIETADLAQGFAAMVAFSDARTLEDNVADIREALARTRTGRVTIAIRDGVAASGSIKAGDAIGFAAEEIVATGPDPAAVASAVIAALGDGEALTILTGADAPPDEAEAVAGAAREILPRAEVEVRDGGQPVHRYLLALE